MPSTPSNLANVMHLIWTEGEISRAEVARRLDLSRSTVSALVQQLIDQGTVMEARVGASQGGRPPVMLRFCADRYHMVGLDLGMTHVTALVMDPRGRVLGSQTFRAEVATDPHGTLALAQVAIQALRELTPVRSRLVGIGVAVPCPVDATRPGRVSASILPAWAEVDVAGTLAAQNGVPVYLENDANLGALGELAWGLGREVRDFVYVKLATGVGAGLIVNGDIYRGADGIAGEIGHTSIDPDGPPCPCGLNGCLVTFTGSRAVEEHYRRLHQGSAGAAPADDLGAIARAAQSGDALARQVIEHAARSLAIGLANLLNLFNPSRIVLGGRLTLAGDALLAPLAHAVRGRALWTNVAAADIVISRHGDDVIPLGAATLVLRTALADPRRFAAGLPSTVPLRRVAVWGGPHPTP